MTNSSFHSFRTLKLGSWHLPTCKWFSNCPRFAYLKEPSFISPPFRQFSFRALLSIVNERSSTITFDLAELIFALACPLIGAIKIPFARRRFSSRGNLEPSFPLYLSRRNARPSKHAGNSSRFLVLKMRIVQPIRNPIRFHESHPSETNSLYQYNNQLLGKQIFLIRRHKITDNYSLIINDNICTLVSA